MKYSIVGTGRVGLAIAAFFAAAGIEVGLANPSVRADGRAKPLYEAMRRGIASNFNAFIVHRQGDLGLTLAMTAQRRSKASLCCSGAAVLSAPTGRRL